MRKKKPLVHVDEGFFMVGATGFEPATSCTPCKRATELRYAPTRATSGFRTHGLLGHNQALYH
jgi:hypothetical protein